MSAAASNTARRPFALALALGVATLLISGSADGARPAPRDRSAPKRPGPIVVSSATATEISVAWAPARDNIGVVGYDTYFDGDPHGSVSEPAGFFARLLCGSGHNVNVQAFDAAGNRSQPSAATVTTSPCSDTQAPSTPSGFAQAATTPTAVVLTWNPSTDDMGVVTYGVYQSGVLVKETAGASATLDNLRCGTTYAFGVDAADAAGNRSDRGTAYVTTGACGDSQPPSAPSNVAVASRTVTSLTLTWSGANDDVGVVSYGLYAGTTRVASVATTTGLISGLTCGTTYSVGVDAADAAGNRSSIASISAATTGCPPVGDTTPPTSPSGLVVTGSAATTIAFSWSASSDNIGVAGYGVYRNGTAVATTPQRTATVNGLQCGTAYTLGVDAYDAAGNRSSRAEVVATTSPCADTQAPSIPGGVNATVRTDTSIALSWLPSSDNVGVVGYGLYRGGTLVATTAQPSGIFSGLSCGIDYTLGVDAYDAAGNRSQQAVVRVGTTACPDTTPPSMPSGLNVSSVTQTNLTLSWSASSDNVGVAGYDVYRNGTKVGSTTAVSAAASGLACGTSYGFGVAAYDVAGNHSPQAQITAVTSSCTPPPPPPAAGLYVSTAGSDSAACTQAAPCATLNRAFSIASPGMTIQVNAGTYPGQTIRGDRGGSVTITAAAGATVTFAGDIRLEGAKHIVLKDFRSTATVHPYLVDYCSDDVKLVNLSGPRFGVISGRNVLVSGGDFGNYSNSTFDGGVSGIDRGCGLNPPVQDVVIDAVRIHDVYYQVPSSQWNGAHPDCIEFNGWMTNVVVKNSVIERCGNSFVMATPNFGPTNGLVFENNTFRDLSNETYFGVQFDDAEHLCSGTIFRNNSYAPNNPNALEPYSPIRTECSGPVATQVTGNTFQRGPDSYSCQVWTSAPFNSRWDSNRFELGRPCGTNPS